ncbi:MAG: FHA domain-containing protein [Planctomycetota bacterium]|jgi:pSer/pThr/pTyr-binding forkhead associated (FHA) protein
MILVVKLKDSVVNEYRFTKGPIYIGRHANSQVFLRDRTVSRQHAVIFKTSDDKWVIEDMDSASKTYLNGEAIHKADIKSGDVINIVDFVIEISLDDQVDDDRPINLEDTLVSPSRKPQVIVRKAEAEDAPAMRIPSKRTKDFAQASEAIANAGNLDNALLTILRLVRRQFGAHRVWCALRRDPAGPMIAHSGKTREGTSLEFEEIEFQDKVRQAIENNEFILMPRINPSDSKENIGSVMIAPIVGQGGCFGVLYIDNDKAHEKYATSDLDYLMLLALQMATILARK